MVTPNVLLSRWRSQSAEVPSWVFSHVALPLAAAHGRGNGYRGTMMRVSARFTWTTLRQSTLRQY